MYLRTLLAVFIVAGSAIAQEPTRFPFEERSIAELQAGLQSGAYTSAELVAAYLARIAQIDRQGPTLRSLININPDAPAIAAQLDAERRRGKVRGPLHGIPIILKDNIETADAMPTTAGSLALAQYQAAQDAFIAQRLRAAGAIVLAKANLSEWANFRSTRASSGWSGIGGQVRNPYALDRTPCGSSSGSAVATAANLAAAAIGTETNGSIVCPASANNIVGLKPTVGLVSRSGIIPISHRQDIAGPMTRTVADAAILLNVIAGEDKTDAMTAGSSSRRAADYTRFLDRDGLRGARIGVVRQRFTGYHTDTDRLFNAALAAMGDAGATIIDSLSFQNINPALSVSYTLLLYDFKTDLNNFLAARADLLPVKSLQQLIEFNERERVRSMPYFGQEIFLEANKKGTLEEKEYRDALERAKLAATSIDSLMNAHQLDAIVAPTGGPPWVADVITGDRFLGGSSSPAAIAGYPNITVPMGFVFGLPVGISLYGRSWSEPVLLRLAYAYEQRTRHRVPPGFLPTADLVKP